MDDSSRVGVGDVDRGLGVGGPRKTPTAEAQIDARGPSSPSAPQPPL